MYYVVCPTCEARVEVPTNAVGPDRNNLWNVVSCDVCDTGFDFEDDEVFAQEQTGD